MANIQVSNEEDIYLAGLFDGEGSISPTNTQGNYGVQITLGSTDRPTIDLLYSRFGGSIVDIDPTKNKHSKRPFWIWRTSGRKAKPFLDCIGPYLRIKKRQYLLYLLFFDTIGEQYKGRTTQEERDEREKLAYLISSANKGEEVG